MWMRKLRGEEAASELVKVIRGTRLPCEVHVDVSLAEDTSQPDQRRGLRYFICQTELSDSA